MAASAASSSASRVASSGLFSTATRAETLRIAGTRCWACSTGAPEICHVVPHHDPQVTPDHPIFSSTTTSNKLTSPTLFRFLYGSKLGCLPSITKTHTTQFLFAALAIPSSTRHLTLDTSFSPQIYSTSLILNAKIMLAENRLQQMPESLFHPFRGRYRRVRTISNMKLTQT